MKVILLCIVGAVLAILAACITPSTLRKDELAQYAKGLKVGRVIGRDEVLGELKSPGCFAQPVDELMGGDEKGDAEWIKKARGDAQELKDLKSKGLALVQPKEAAVGGTQGKTK